MPSFRCSKCNAELPTDAGGDPLDCPACGEHSPVLDMRFPSVGPRTPAQGITVLDRPPAPPPGAVRVGPVAPPVPPADAVRRGPLPPPDVPAADAIRGGPPAPLRLVPEDDTVDDRGEGNAFVDDLLDEARAEEEGLGRRRRRGIGYEAPTTWVTPFLVMLGLLVALGLVFLVLALRDPLAVPMLFLYGSVLAFVGTVWMWNIAFPEGDFIFAFLPGFNLHYIYWNFDEGSKPGAVQYLGGLMLFFAYALLRWWHHG
jgi:hypothetical protein